MADDELMKGMSQISIDDNIENRGDEGDVDQNLIQIVDSVLSLKSSAQRSVSITLFRQKTNLITPTRVPIVW